MPLICLYRAHVHTSAACGSDLQLSLAAPGWVIQNAEKWGKVSNWPDQAEHLIVTQ